MLIDFHLNTRARFLLKKPPTYTLTFKLYDHRVARRIWEICLKNPLPPVSRDRFYGFNDSLEDIEKSLHNCVEQIKTLRPDLNLENIDANYLHENFVNLHSNLTDSELDKKLSHWLSILNYKIHQYEQIVAFETPPKRFITTTNYTGEPLEDDDYDLFTLESTPDILYMNYPHVGKDPFAVFTDNDVTIPKEHIHPTSVLKPDFLVYFTKPSLLPPESLLIRAKRFLARMYKKLPYDVDDKRMAYGRIPLGKLVGKADLDIIAENLFIDRIEVR
jgi:hypothetical protein